MQTGARRNDRVLDIVRRMVMEEEPRSIVEVHEVSQSEPILMDQATLNEPIEETEQPLLSFEEVKTNLKSRTSEATGADMEMDGHQLVGWNSTERVEKKTDETPDSRKVMNVTDDEEETEKVPPRDEAAEARVAPIRIYQRKPAREETSGKRYEEEQLWEAPIQRTWEDMNSPARSAVVHFKVTQL